MPDGSLLPVLYVTKSTSARLEVRGAGGVVICHYYPIDDFACSVVEVEWVIDVDTHEIIGAVYCCDSAYLASYAGMKLGLSPSSAPLGPCSRLVRVRSKHLVSVDHRDVITDVRHRASRSAYGDSSHEANVSRALGYGLHIRTIVDCCIARRCSVVNGLAP